MDKGSMYAYENLEMIEDDIFWLFVEFIKIFNK